MSRFRGSVFLFLVALLAYVSVSTQAHVIMSPQLSTSPEYYYARYRINGDRPDGFGEIAYLVLGLRHSPSGTHREEESVKYDDQGNALIKGEVWTEGGASFPFETAKLSRSTTLRRDGCGLFTQLVMITERKAGVSYSFQGEFLEQPERLGEGNYTRLRGVLVKFKYQQKVADAKVDFTRLSIR